MFTQIGSTRKSWARLMLILPLLVLLIGNARAQTTQFTYQGKLTDNGGPANGHYDFQCKLFDTDTVGTGTQQGSTLGVPNVLVTAGTFIVPLDFGSSVFPGAPRFLEIAVKPTGAAAFTTLSPRQAVTANPYAIHTLNADGLSVACVNCITSSQIQSVSGSAVTGTIPVASVPAGSAVYIQNSATQQTANFNVAGSGTANILDATTQFNLGGNRILSNAGTENLFAGVNAGASNTDGFSNAFLGSGAGMINTIGRENTFVGSNAGLNNTFANANSFFGARAGTNTTGIGGLNSFFGWETGLMNTTGSRNSFFGMAAGRENTIGNDNAFFGEFAGAQTTTGSTNTFLGVVAGRNNTTGSNNVFIGRAAGNPDTTTQVSNSVAIGTNAVVSTSNTIVLGTSAQATQIPGLMVAGNGAMRVVSSSIGGGVVGENLYIHQLDHPAALPHLCWRVAPDGVEALLITTCTSSSAPSSFKTDLQPYASGLEVINRLQPMSFTWKDGGARDFGLSAEAVAKVAPLLVTRNSKGEVEDVKHENFSALFINAFKEQQAQIKRQQQEIDALKKLVCADHPLADVCK